MILHNKAGKERDLSQLYLVDKTQSQNQLGIKMSRTDLVSYERMRTS